MSGCDFVGSILGVGQDMSQGTFEKCIFGPPRSGLRRLNLTKVNLSRSILRDAILEDISLIDCNLEETDLTNANISRSDCSGSAFTNANLTGADLRYTNLFGARFDRTRLTLRKRPVLQEDSRAWKQWCHAHGYGDIAESERIEQAVAIYLELKKNFRSIGSYSEASWAYVQERRMRRAQHSIPLAPQCFELDYPSVLAKRIGFYIQHSLAWLADFVIDIATGYGESLLRTMLTLITTVCLVFPLLYLFAGGVRISTNTGAYIITNDYSHLFLLSLGSVLQGFPGVEVATEIGRQVQMVEQFFGVMLIGLLGFVLGKRINQS